jgi:hypothetical protein
MGKKRKNPMGARKILELLKAGEVDYCSSCDGLILYKEDIIGDGTNRGLCCVPYYYDD